MNLDDKLEEITKSVKDGTNIHFKKQEYCIIKDAKEIHSNTLINSGAIVSDCCRERVNMYYNNHGVVYRCSECDEKCDREWHIELYSLEILLKVFEQAKINAKFSHINFLGDYVYTAIMDSDKFSKMYKYCFSESKEREGESSFGTWYYDRDKNRGLHKALKAPITGDVAIEYRIPYKVIKDDIEEEIKLSLLLREWIQDWGRLS